MSFGKPICESSAILVAKNFYSVESHRSKDNLNATIAYKAENNAYYVVNIDNEGFVIVAGDDIVRPILAYSTEGAFLTENIPEHIRFFLSGYAEEIGFMIDNNIKAESEVCIQWSNLLSEEAIATREGNVVIEPLLGNNKWNQTKYYNNLCPADASGNSAYGGHAAVGCGALVMGQVMRYWQYPTIGTGSHSYTCNYASYGYGNYGTLSANFGATTYDFPNMPERLISTSSAEEIEAVATLLYHCGVSVDMTYGPSASTVNSNKIVSSLSTYFNYPATIEYHERGSISADSWISHLKEELDERAPFMYGGSGNYGGHVWICDGYRDDNFFHFNWGWGGQQNGYYTIANCSSYGFNSNHAVIVGIRGPLMPYSITTKILPANTGSATGAGSYLETHTATLYAEGKRGNHFVSWTENGEVVSTDSTYSFIVERARNLVANFEPNTTNSEVFSETKISIYPNPTTDYVNMQCSLIDASQVKIYDVYGKLIDNQDISGSTFAIDFSQYPAATYFMHIVGDSGMETIKVVKL